MPLKFSITMKKKFYFPGLNSKSKRVFSIERHIQDIVNTIDKLDYPLIHSFVNSTNSFYRANFDNLKNYKLREKRLIDFETPNRARIVQEYDLGLPENFDYSQFTYLFNPRNRLNWLKIKQEDKRIIVADKKTIEALVYKLLLSELENIALLHKIKKETIFTYVWERQQGYPCFIKLEKNGRKNFLLEAEYFDSIKEDNNSSYPFYKYLLFPIDERVISYEYYPLKDKSSWLYIRSPKNFNVSINNNNIEYESDVNDVESYISNKMQGGSSSDPEIITLTIVNKKEAEEKKYNVKFNIEINVPNSLKTWYLSLYWSSLALLCILFFELINRLYFICGGKLISTFDPFGSIIHQDSFNNILLAFVAGIITTRGWLISEETILKRYSNYLTGVMIFLILIPIILRLLQ